MAQDPIVAIVHSEPAVLETTHGADQAVPSAEKQQVADDVFSPEVQKAAAVLLSLQMGMGLAHHLIVEHASHDEEECEDPKRCCQHTPRKPML